MTIKKFCYCNRPCKTMTCERNYKHLSESDHRFYAFARFGECEDFEEDTK
jgi:hypothetical protein